MNKRDWQLLRHAMESVEEGELDKAFVICNKFLSDDPNNPVALNVMTAALLKSGDKTPIAYHLAKRLAEINPKDVSTWINLSRAATDLWLVQEGLRAARKGLSIASKDRDRLILLINLSAALIDIGKFDEAEQKAKEALAIDPESQKAKANLGFCQLAKREWVPGWQNYRCSLGTGWRKPNHYVDEPEWDGTPGKNVILYGEQGLGDEISFASMVPDAIDSCKKVVLDVDKRLLGLFRRSFPKAKVYGTRGLKTLAWEREDFEHVDASLAMGQIGEYFRQKDEDFPGKPYLVPDPDRVTMWKALWKTKEKPVIGIAWSGGIPRTGAKFRKWDLETLRPILQSIDAHFVSLQYKPADYDIEQFVQVHKDVDLKEYPHGTLTKDYDDTAAMVASLDLVICMQTAVGHLAGALGVPAWVFVPTNSQWRYGQGTERLVWYDSVKLIRQKEEGKWSREINQVAEDLKRRFRSLEAVNAD